MTNNIDEQNVEKEFDDYIKFIEKYSGKIKIGREGEDFLKKFFKIIYEMNKEEISREKKEESQLHS